ncbi:MAG: sensor histidine kinase [Flavobacteriales bacterium]|nr:sensor histidine kinase [Flavobacteriales bacterium]
MTSQPRRALAQLLRAGKVELLATWRAQVRELPSAKHLDVPTLNDHIPGLIDEIAVSLELGDDRTIAQNLREGTPPEHGAQRVEDGFDIIEVVSEYNILRGCVHALADQHDIRMDRNLLHVLNMVMDGAIGMAVQTFAEEKAHEVRKRRQEYLAFVAHDLRNPLTAISLSAALLEATMKKAEVDEETTHVFRTLHRNVGQLETLVTKVLEENANLLSEEGLSLERRHFDLWALVEAVIQSMAPVAADAGTRLVNAIPKELVVYADAELLRRVFQNLIGNAITYTARGEVRIGAAMNDLRNGTACWVTDNGSGIDKDRLDSIFDKGEGDVERIDSTGLGLAIVKTFIEAHGGTVRAQSEKGQGTTIRFELPDRQ